MLLKDVFDQHAPIKKWIIKKPSVPYINSQLRKCIHKKSMLRHKVKTGKVHWDLYRKHRNYTTKVNVESKVKYFHERCNNGPRNVKFWQTIKPFLSNKNCFKDNITALREGENIITEDQAICNILNTNFISSAQNIGFQDVLPENIHNDTVFDQLINKYDEHPSIIMIRRHSTIGPQFEFTPPSMEEVHLIIRKLNAKKSAGHDNVPAKLIKTGIDPLSEIITSIISESIHKSTFPDDLKYALVTAIFKKNDELDKKNYRGVSVLPVISKIFERVMEKPLLNYFSAIFSPFLSAYRHGYSCQSNLIHMIEEWKRALDEGNFVGCLGMDLSKAFDCLPHSLLISKLYAYGLSRNACKYVASYLSNRKQRVKLGNTLSEWSDLDKGVPQGSILGPLLFNVFLNDIFYFVNVCTLNNYADDNYLSSKGCSKEYVEQNLKNDGTVLCKWFQDNGMAPNLTKFVAFAMGFSSNMLDMTITLNDVLIESIPNINILGVNFDNKLNFDAHVNALCVKASRQVSVLQRLSYFLDFESRKTIYRTFILSNFSYCPVVWYFTSKKSMNMIAKIQERALRFVLKDYLSSYEELLETLQDVPIRITILRCIAIEVYKILNDQSPSYLNNLFEVIDVPYDLRDSNVVEQPLVRTVTYGIKSLRYFGAKLWNNLPADLKSACSLADFKEILKTWTGPTCACEVCNMV